jgi:hypothetical protein
MKNTETEVIRGEQQISIEELYALLLHTSSTHAGFEFCIWPWSTRDFGLNLSPHGWFSAKFRTLLRDMKVREQGNELHLLSSISPEWIQTGKSITVRRAPTEFGEVNFELQTAAEGESVLRLGNSLKRPVRVIVHLPWFWDVTSATADGKAAPVSKAAVLVPPNTKEIRIRWTRKGSIPKLSYAQAVEDYKAEYRRRYAQFLSGSGQ